MAPNRQIEEQAAEDDNDSDCNLNLKDLQEFATEECSQMSEVELQLEAYYFSQHESILKSKSQPPQQRRLFL